MSTIRNHYVCAMTIITHSDKNYQRILNHEEDICIYADILNENGKLIKITKGNLETMTSKRCILPHDHISSMWYFCILCAP